uniref:Junctional adhesion molecule A n=1 Tax=Denticeps clupeoides TaxID=299321 RepID=A0AAY4DYW5_9TELE
SVGRGVETPGIRRFLCLYLSGADLTCTYSADFGSSPRVEWKFKDLLGIQTSYVFYDGKPTSQYADRVTQYNGGLRFSKVTRKDTGQYDCTVAGQGQYADAKIQLIVLVPPSPPICRIPLSVTTDRNTLLTCEDPQASPPATYKWYFNNVPLPEDPSKFSSFQNSSYKVNTVTGSLAFPRVSKVDAGEYFCEAINEAGPAQRCAAVRMEVREYDLNTGGIAAGIILALLAVALLGFALWFAYRKGYLPSTLLLPTDAAF